MKLIKYKKYSFYDNFKHNVNIGILSDLHFSKYVLDRTYKTFEMMSKKDIEYLLIPGDLLNYYDVVYNEKVYNTIIDCFKLVTNNNIKIILIFGNHDYYTCLKEKKCKLDSFNSEFFKKLKSMKNVTLLNNDIYSDDKINVVGMSLSIKYYGKKENKKILLDELKSIEPKVKKIENNGNINIMLLHSPIYITDESVKKYIDRYDNIFCGHQHNGCIPIILDDIWKSNKGIMGAYYNLFPKISRGIIDKKIIIAGAVNFIQPTNLINKLAGLFFPISVSEINYIKSDKKDYKLKEKYTKKQF